MPIRYEGDEHIVTITIDRPARRNALDLEHFDALADAWKRFRDDADAWVAIVTGVDDAFCAGGDLRDYIPLLTASGPEDRERVPFRYRGGAARPRHLQADHRRRQRPLRGGWDGAAERDRHPARVSGSHLRPGRTEAGHSGQRRNHRPTPPPDRVAGRHGVPADGRARAGDPRPRAGAPQRDRPPASAPGARPRLGRAHHRQRAARGRRHQGERAAGARGRIPGGGPADRGSAQPPGARHQRRARRPARVHREARADAGRRAERSSTTTGPSRSDASSSPGTRRSGCR